MEPARLDSRCRCLGDAAGKMTPRCARKPEPRGHEPRTTSWAPGVTEGRRQLRAWRRVTGPRNQRPPASPVLTDVPSPGRAALRRRIALCALLRVRLRAAADEQQLRAHEATSVARPVPKRPGPGSEEGFAVPSQRGRRRGGAMWGPGPGSGRRTAWARTAGRSGPGQRSSATGTPGVTVQGEVSPAGETRA